MAVYRKCRTCTKNDEACPDKLALKKALKGLSVTSVLHNCASYSPPHKPGDPILYKYSLADEHGDYDGEFPGHFIRQSGVRALIYIKPGTTDPDGIVFEPTGNGNGFCKVSFSRIRADIDGSVVTICHICDGPAGSCDMHDWFDCPQESPTDD